MLGQTWGHKTLYTNLAIATNQHSIPWIRLIVPRARVTIDVVGFVSWKDRIIAGFNEE